MGKRQSSPEVQRRVYEHLERFVCRPCPHNDDIAEATTMTLATASRAINDMKREGRIGVTFENGLRVVDFLDGRRTLPQLHAKHPRSGPKIERKCLRCGNTFKISPSDRTKRFLCNYHTSIAETADYAFAV